MDTTLPSTSSTLFNVPKLAEDGTNWITYKERTLTAIGARGLMRYADGRAIQPVPFVVDPKTNQPVKSDGTAATQTEIDDQNDKIDEFYQKDSLVKQQIFSTISDRVLLLVQKLDGAYAIWAEICRIHEGKTELVQIDLRRRLQEMRCEEGGDIKAHFSEQLRLRESLAGMGAAILDRDFYAIILGSLPESYRPLVSSINAAAKIAQKPLTPHELVNIITEEYEHRQLTERRTSKKAGNAALSAKMHAGKANTMNSSSQNNQDITCHNCDRKGHYKSDCWRKGGGKEGQGPRQRKGRHPQKQSANAANATDAQDNYAFASSDMASIAKDLNLPVERRGAIIDSGATSHFCPDRSKFVTFTSITPQDVHTADGSAISAIGRGNVKIDLPISCRKGINRGRRT